MQAFERRLIDVAQASATVRDVLMKNKTRKGQKLLYIQSYNYTAPFTNVAGTSAASVTNVQTQGDSDFLMCYMSGNLYNASTLARITAPYARLQISDNSTNRTMFDKPVLFGLVTGDGGFPYLLQDPRLIPASTVLQVTLYNDLTVGPITVSGQVSFGGYRAVYQQ